MKGYIDYQFLIGYLLSGKTEMKYICFMVSLIFLASKPIQSQTCDSIVTVCDYRAGFQAELDGDSLYLSPVMPEDTVWGYTWRIYYDSTHFETVAGYLLKLPISDGVLDVELHVTDNEKFNTFCQKTIDIAEDCPTAEFTFTSAGLGVSFKPLDSLGDVHIHGSLWDFGDRATSSEFSPYHEYGDSGVYTVAHTLLFFESEQPSTIKLRYCDQEVSAFRTEGPAPGFSVVYSEKCCEMAVCFHPASITGNHTWSFGDGGTSTQVSPCHPYTNFSSYSDATPTVSVTHCVNVTQCTTQVISLAVNGPGYYLGSNNSTTYIDGLLSTIDGEPLFPTNSIDGLPGNGNNKMVHVSGDLVIDESFDVSIAHFCMNPASDIRVWQGKTLKGNEVGFSNALGCNIWKGIELEAESTLDLKISGIQSALYGIRTLGEGSTISLDAMGFLFNFIGIFAEHNFELPLFNGVNISAAGLDPIGSLVLDSDIPVPYLPPTGFAGIFAKNISLNIPGHSADNYYSNFLFSNSNGIWLENSNAVVQRCVMHDFLTTDYGPNFSGDGIRFFAKGTRTLKNFGPGLSGLAYDAFTNCVNGIRAFSVGPNTLIQSKGNKMVDVHNGYQINISSGNLASGTRINENIIGCKRTGVEVNIGNPGIVNNLSVNDNTINIGQGTVLSPGIGVWINSLAGTSVGQNISIYDNTAIDLYKGESGITISNARGVHVEGNTVTLHSPILKRRTGIHLEYGGDNTVSCTNNISGASGSTLGKSYSIFVENSGHDLITANNTSGTNFGIHVDLPSISKNNIRCNIMNGHKVGLSYTKTANSDIQTNMGNQWTGSWSGGNVGARHLGESDNFVALSRYRASTSVTTTSGIQWPPPTGTDLTPNTADPWFFTGSLANCGTITACDEMATQSVGSLDSAVATVTFDFDEGEEVVNWMMKQDLYQRLSKDTSLMSGNSLMQSFKSSYNTAPLGQLYNSGMQTQALFEPTNLQNDTLQVGFDSIQAVLAYIADLTELINDTTYISVRDSLMELKYGKLAYIDSLNATLEDLWGRFITKRMTDADTIISSNAAITTVGDYDANEQSLHDLFLQTKAKGEELDMEQIALLCDMANQCPLEGGPATFWARAWYAAETGIRINTEACETPEDRASNEEVAEARQEDKNWLAVSPNPTAGAFEISYYCAEEMPVGLVSITGSYGQAVATFAIGHEQSGKLNVDTLDLPPGIYFIQLQSTGRTLAVQKLVVNR